jgi:hypothetical protein
MSAPAHGDRPGNFSQGRGQGKGSFPRETLNRERANPKLDFSAMSLVIQGFWRSGAKTFT